MTKLLNPIIILLFTIVLSSISYISLLSSKKDLEQTKEEFKLFNTLALQYNQYNTIYANKQQIIKELKTILATTHLSSSNLKVDKKTITIEIKKVDIKVLDRFINKLLNKKFNIIYFNLKENYLKVMIRL